jgi:SAM-dependent methyltransferase
MSGSPAEAYEHGLCPTIFDPYARDLRERLSPFDGMRILETAAGTGVVTRVFLERLPADARLVATDVNPAMIDVGRPLLGDDPRLEWRVADAQALPFDHDSFDAVVCQFGVMFFPDKPLAMREARRMLRPGGNLLLNTWDSLAVNDFARITNETLAELFPADPPRFFHEPFSYSDPEAIRDLLAEAGFADVRVEHIEKVAECDSAERFARGLVLGTPILGDIEARGTKDPAAVISVLTEWLAMLGGIAPFRSPIHAVVASARA